MFVAEKRFISDVIKNRGKHCISLDGGTWILQACRFLKLNHHIHSSFEKWLIERTRQYIKDRTKCFADYFSCKLKNCKLNQVWNLLTIFINYHNKEMIHA